MFKRALRRFKENNIAIQRAIVTVAAVMALFPLAVWMLEAEERRLERAALLVEANLSCAEAARNKEIFTYDIVDVLAGGDISNSDNPGEQGFVPTDAWKENVELMCIEIQLAAFLDEDIIQRLRLIQEGEIGWTMQR